MNKYLLITAIFLSVNTQGIYAQYTPRDRCVHDSLYRIMSHSGQIKTVSYTHLTLPTRG